MEASLLWYQTPPPCTSGGETISIIWGSFFLTEMLFVQWAIFFW